MVVPAPSSLPRPDAAKPALRDSALARRKTALDPGAAAKVAFHFLGAFDLPAGAVVAGYLPMGSELDILPLVTTLASRGYPVAMPVVVKGATTLTFRTWSDDTALEPGPAGTRHPRTDSPAVTPDVLLVPLLAVDDAGIRLGYGKGYYDLTIARLRAAGRLLAIGVGYAAQRVAHLPRDPWDVPLDAFVAEDGVRHFA